MKVISKNPGIIFIPGGFSFGDYLRAGILATHSPAIKEVVRYSKKECQLLEYVTDFKYQSECNLLDGFIALSQLFK